jgi:hypothetical protein
VLACDSTRRRPRKIEAGTSHENSIEVANRHRSLNLFVLIYFDAFVWRQ